MAVLAKSLEDAQEDLLSVERAKRRLNEISIEYDEKLEQQKKSL